MGSYYGGYSHFYFMLIQIVLMEKILSSSLMDSFRSFYDIVLIYELLRHELWGVRGNRVGLDWISSVM